MKMVVRLSVFFGDEGLVTYPLFIKSIKQQIANLTICCLILQNHGLRQISKNPVVKNLLYKT